LFPVYRFELQEQEHGFLLSLLLINALKATITSTVKNTYITAQVKYGTIDPDIVAV